MSIDENEVAAANRQRRIEDAPISRVGSQIGEILPFATSTLAVTKALDTGSNPSVALILGGIVGGLGIVDWFRKQASSKVSENLEVLGQATEEALKRVERTLVAQGLTVDQLSCRLESQEFKDGIAVAVLQSTRTSQHARLKRMADILAGAVKENDFESESLDDMLRAAVELKESDISLLGLIYESQADLVRRQRPGEAPFKWHGDLQTVWRQFTDSGKLNPQEHLKYRSSLARLEALGFVQWISSAGDYGAGLEIYALLFEGKRFYERVISFARNREV